MIVIIPILLLFAIYHIYIWLNPPPRVTNPSSRYVVISGCDSGFGYMLAQQLDKLQYNVYAGCLTDQGIQQIQSTCSKRVHPIRLDITKQNDIDSLVNTVKQSTSTIHALVNNAGIGEGGFVDWMSNDMYRKVMDVNLFGHIQMTKSFIPLLIAQRNSRVVNVTSAAGIIAFPGLSAYSASKFALEAFSDALRREMYQFGLHVSIVEPGYMATAIITNGLSSQEKQWQSVSNDVRSRWGDDTHNAYLNSNSRLTGRAGDPQSVVHELIDCVTSSRPYSRYRVGPGAKIALLIQSMPTFITDYILQLFVSGVPKPKFIRDGLQKNVL